MFAAISSLFEAVTFTRPEGQLSLAGSAVPNTTYTLTTGGSLLVASALDPDSHTQAATYTTLNSVASATPASGGATTFTYGSNSGESLTQVASAAGASSSAAYANTGASQYSPSSTTSDSANTLNYTYNGQGNQLTSAQGVGGPQALVTYNSDGTAATSASPGAGVVTTYGVDAVHDLTAITPPSGTSLGSRAYTWDGFARLSTATDGRGNTTPTPMTTPTGSPRSTAPRAGWPMSPTPTTNSIGSPNASTPPAPPPTPTTP